MMKTPLLIIVAALSWAGASAQRVLSLEDCKNMAVNASNGLKIAQIKGEAANEMHKSARTLALPRANAIAGYQHFGREISLLSDQQKDRLSHLGQNATGKIAEQFSSTLMPLVEKGIITPAQMENLGQMFGASAGSLAGSLDQVGETVKSAMRTDTRDMWGAAVLVSQPIYAGGAISAANNIAATARDITATQLEQTRQNTLYEIERAYWLTVKLSRSKSLAEKHDSLVSQLNRNVKRSIAEGVATRADGLKVDVALSEAEMVLMQVDNGLRLSKMRICQLCGLPLDTDITLADEQSSTLSCPVAFADDAASYDMASSQRPELKMLSQVVRLSQLSVKEVRALGRPQLMATLGVMATNPNLYNGYERHLSVNWNVGVIARMPLIDWRANHHKVSAAKAFTRIAMLERDEAAELIALQTAQERFKLNEAKRQLSLAKDNINKAEENLRCANLGFEEGVMTSIDVLAAQTAWMQAETNRINAEIALIEAQLSLNKALGKL